ncbi:hypothetical protein X797_004556 [Metarhizium robertsii]|uniref:Uncharacterized protein n=1 Tax=Metarhizium robertsii TaxID=568076 RepID=A0A0A1UYK6_9HYPO|nr:hypothetical protein X797_004556 [Metarhizium robertsii]
MNAPENKEEAYIYALDYRGWCGGTLLAIVLKTLQFPTTLTGEKCAPSLSTRLYGSDTPDPYHVGRAGVAACRIRLLLDLMGLLRCAHALPSTWLLILKVLEQARRANKFVKVEFVPHKECLKRDLKRGLQQRLGADNSSTQGFSRHGGPEGTGLKYNLSALRWTEIQNTSSGSFGTALDSGKHLPSSRWCVNGGAVLLTDAMKKLSEQRGPDEEACHSRRD